MRQPNEDPGVLSSAAIEASERGRARSLLELLNESRIEIRRGVDESLLKQERFRSAGIKHCGRGADQTD